MITFSIIKLFLGNAIGFIAKHWRVILLGLIVSVALYYKSAYERTVQELATFKHDIAELTAKTQHENEKKLIIAQNAVKTATLKSQAEMERLNLDRVRETKNLKGLYENTLNRTKFNYDDRLRLEAERNRLGMSAADNDTSTLAESERNGDTAAYRTLERACQITTIDYNELRGWADAACNMAGCLKP